MSRDVRPLSHEIANVYITGDGKRFLDEKEAKEHQSKIELNSLFELNKARD